MNYRLDNDYITEYYLDRMEERERERYERRIAERLLEPFREAKERKESKMSEEDKYLDRLGVE